MNFSITLMDAVIALLLADRIHGTDDSIRETAKRCAKLLPRSKRHLMYKVVESHAPHDFVIAIARNLDV